MSGELKAVSIPGSIVYARILSGERIWNGTILDNYSASNYGTYAVSIAEQGGSGVFVGNFPPLITTAGAYDIFYHLQEGAAPAEGDRIVSTGSISWSGSAVVSPVDLAIAGAMAGSDFRDYVVRIFKRDDKDTELYEAASDMIGEIRRVLRLEENETEATITDTISVLGDYRMDLPADFGRLISDIVVQDGQQSWTLVKLSKARFDDLYTGKGTNEVPPDYPKHYCVFDEQIFVGPVPKSLSYNYTISYTTGGQPTITAATLSVPFTDKGRRKILRDGVLSELYRGLENFEFSKTYREAFILGLSQEDDRQTHNRDAVMNIAYCDF